MRKFYVATGGLQMRTVLAGIVLLFSVVAAAAQAPTISKADITQSGIYEAKITGRTPAPGTAAGYTNKVEYHFVSNATMVPARKGVRFGFEYRLVGAPEGAKVAIRRVTIFPSGGLRNAQTGQVAQNDEVTVQNTIGDLSLKGYGLDNDWEAVPGVWIQQIWYGDQKLAEQNFTLVKP
jgi:Domain of unknown function (DUF3859)